MGSRKLGTRLGTASPRPSPPPASLPPKRPPGATAAWLPSAGTLPVECGSVTGCVTGALGGTECLLVHQLPGSTGRTDVKGKAVPDPGRGRHNILYPGHLLKFNTKGQGAKPQLSICEPQEGSWGRENPRPDLWPKDRVGQAPTPIKGPLGREEICHRAGLCQAQACEVGTLVGSPATGSH